MENIDYLCNPDAMRPFLEKNYFLNVQLGFQIIEHGIIIPHRGGGVFGSSGGIFDSKGSFVKNSLFAEAPLHNSNSYTPSGESISYSSETVVYLGAFLSSWGHGLTDNIRFMWFLKSDYFKEFKNCPLVYLNQRGSSLKNRRDFARLLEILELDVNNIREIKQPTQFERIIMPDGSFKSPINKIAGFTNEYREVIDRVRSFGLKHGTPISNKKAYFFNGMKNQTGEEHLAEYFKSKGYAIIDPVRQKLTFDDELNILVNCESFAVIVGSSAINSLFLRDGTETILIPRIASHIDDTVQVATQVHPLNLSYVDSTLSIFR